MIKDDESLFKSLQVKPRVAVPTVLLAIVCAGTFWSMIVLGILGEVSLWTGCIVNCIAGYYLFSPIHDALHRSVFRNNTLNDIFAFVVVNGLTPYASMHLFRFMHMQHHRFANEEEKDPDHFAGKAGWGVLTLWFFWDILYLFKYLKLAGERPRKEKVYITLSIAIGLPITIYLFTLYPVELFWLWFVPNRVTLWLICFVFMYITHLPHDVHHRDNPYQATLIREGWNWLMDPLLAYQNWHLVHHLYPTIPWYRMKKAWYARYSEHMKHNPAVVPVFQIHPSGKTIPA